MLRPVTAWVDPGGMTGIAIWQSAMGGFFSAAEYPFDEAGDALWDLAGNYGRSMAIGWERFTVGPQTHKLTSQPEAMEVIGLCRWVAHYHGCHVLTPAQQHSPDRADREALQKIGWWVPGKDDAQSAACHMLRWMKRENELPASVRQALSAP